MKRNRFTLIELLVVVAIIGILVTILMPSLQSAKDKAKLMVCLNNHKQLATAYNSYASANNNFAALHKWYSDFAGFEGNHRYATPYKPEDRPLNYYLNDINGTSKITLCPSDKGDAMYPTRKGTIYWNMGNSYRAKYGTSVPIAKSTNVTNRAGTEWSKGIMTIKFDFPDKKITFWSNQINQSRTFAHEMARWHSDKKPIYPAGFVDGHAEIVNHSWKPPRGTSSPNFEVNSVKSRTENHIDIYGFY